MSDWHTQETYKGLIQIAMGSLRFIALANGGAAIALLAFLGNIESNALNPANVKSAMGFFVAGVSVGGLAFLTAYLTQLRLYEESAHGLPHEGPIKHTNLLWFTVILTLLGNVLFCLGAWCGAKIIAA